MDGDTNLSTLTAPQVIALIAAKRFHYVDLDRRTRLALVAELRNDGKSQAEIAQLFGCSKRTIENDCRRLAQQLAKLAKGVTLDRIVGHLIATAALIQQKALAKGDHELAWRVECQLIEKLQTLGKVHAAPVEFKGALTIAELVTQAQSTNGHHVPNRVAAHLEPPAGH